MEEVCVEQSFYTMLTRKILMNLYLEKLINDQLQGSRWLFFNLLDTQSKINVNVHKEVIVGIYQFCTTLMQHNHKTIVFLYFLFYNECNF